MDDETNQRTVVAVERTTIPLDIIVYQDESGHYWQETYASPSPGPRTLTEAEALSIWNKATTEDKQSLNTAFSRSAHVAYDGGVYRRITRAMPINTIGDLPQEDEMTRQRPSRRRSAMRRRAQEREARAERNERREHCS